jgi:hypothetical protein
VLPLCIEIGLHNPVTSDWIRLVGAMAKPLNVTALVQDTLMLENKKCKDTGYSHTCKFILFAGLYQHRVKTGAPRKEGLLQIICWCMPEIPEGSLGKKKVAQAERCSATLPHITGQSSSGISPL